MFEIGATLREARERRHLTYDQVEADTKIRAKYLRALEEEEFDSLPSGTYVRGFLRAYASYLGLDGRLFVDEYASRFGTRHDDELFRRRERPMTQRRESSSAVLVALIAVVAIGVLFFVAWRFGSGDEATPPLSVVQTVTRTVDNPNGNIETVVSTASTTTTSGRRTVLERQPVHLRVDVLHATTWVKITRISSGKPIAQTEVPAGHSLGGGGLSDTYGFAIQTAIPLNLSLLVNGLQFSLRGKGPWLITADTSGPHVATGPIPPPAIKEG